MTLEQLQDGLTRICDHLRAVDWQIPGRRFRSLVIEFRPSVEGMVPGIERQFAADQLRKSGLCRTIMTLDELTLRADGVPARKLMSFLKAAEDLGARRWGAIA